MAFAHPQKEKLVQMAEAPVKLVRTGDPVIDHFREAMVKRAGGSGYLGLSHILKRMDQNGDRTLSLFELSDGLEQYQLHFRKEDLERLFNFLDGKKSGKITIEQFIRGIRPEMSMHRRDLVMQAFQLLDVDRSGEVSMSEIKSLYDATHHPLVLAGKKTVDEVIADFAADWDRNHDGTVTAEEFLDYYNNLSATIDRDDYFELMIRNAWHISGGEGVAQNTTCLRVLVTYEDGRQAVVELRNDLRVNKKDPAAIRQHLEKQGVKGIKAVSLKDSV